MLRSLLFASSVAAAACTLLVSSAVAQPYPARPLRIVVGFQPGGGVDISARAIGKHLSEALGQSVVVENRPGAAGNIAAASIAKASADGYSLLMANTTIAIPSLFTKLAFDIEKDLDPVSLVAIGPSVLVAHPSTPINTIKDLIAAAKAKPRQLSFGSGGIGNITHLEMELVKVITGIDLVHVPYKGSAPSIVGLLSGEVHVLFTSIPAALGQIKAAKLKAIAVSTLKRSSALPDVPTIHETGLPGYDAASWYGLFVPAGTPRERSTAVAREIVKIMDVPDVREKFKADGFEPAGLGPEPFRKFLREELRKWTKVVQAAGIKPE